LELAVARETVIRRLAKKAVITAGLLLDRRFLLGVFGNVVGINLVQPDGAARLSLEQFAIFSH
jgi:hypothetical protein